MPGSIASRWPVVVKLPVDGADRDKDGHLTAGAVERLFATARSAYFARCATIDEPGLALLTCAIRVGAVVEGNHVTVAVNVTEVFPESFRLEARIRPQQGEGIAATATCSVSPGLVSTAMRDEFIALAQSAAHYH